MLTLPKELMDEAAPKEELDATLKASLLLLDFQKYKGIPVEEIFAKKQEVIKLATTDLNAACQIALDWSRSKKH